jgi:hypothetical protein
MVIAMERVLDVLLQLSVRLHMEDEAVCQVLYQREHQPASQKQANRRQHINKPVPEAVDKQARGYHQENGDGNGNVRVR